MPLLRVLLSVPAPFDLISLPLAVSLSEMYPKTQVIPQQLFVPNVFWSAALKSVKFSNPIGREVTAE